MELLKDSDFRKELKSAPRTGYFFFGDEDYLKTFAIQQARDAVCPDPAFAVFNELRIDALEYTPQRLLDALTPLPMMTERKLVILNGLNFNTMRPEELDHLCDVLDELKVYDYNLLIVNAAADCFDPGYLPKKPSSAFKKLTAYLTPVQFERCTTAKLCTWIQKHFAHNGIDASPALCTAMAEYCGHSMFVLANEIDKLSYYLHYHGQSQATEEAMRICCTPTAEFDAFAFANALLAGKQDIALAILADYRFRRMDPLMVLGEVTRVVCNMLSVYSMTADGIPAGSMTTVIKMTEFQIGLYQKSLRQASDKRLKRALKACLDADNAMKNSYSKDYTALEKLICTL